MAKELWKYFLLFPLISFLDYVKQPLDINPTDLCSCAHEFYFFPLLSCMDISHPDSLGFAFPQAYSEQVLMIALREEVSGEFDLRSPRTNTFISSYMCAFSF